MDSKAPEPGARSPEAPFGDLREFSSEFHRVSERSEAFEDLGSTWGLGVQSESGVDSAVRA